MSLQWTESEGLLRLKVWCPGRSHGMAAGSCPAYRSGWLHMSVSVRTRTTFSTCIRHLRFFHIHTVSQRQVVDTLLQYSQAQDKYLMPAVKASCAVPLSQEQTFGRDASRCDGITCIMTIARSRLCTLVDAPLRAYTSSTGTMLK